MGFTVNVEKSQLVPFNEILYLGFIINSIAMRLQFPAVKLEKIVSACKALSAKHQRSVRDVAKLTGLLVSALPAVNYLEMHYRSLELCKTQTLSGSLDYDKTLSLISQARSDLQWVIENITQCNGRLFQVPKIDIYIQCDASLIGWEAVTGSLSASGRWVKVNHFMVSSVLCLSQGPFMLDLQLKIPLQWPILIKWGVNDPPY